MVTSGATGPCFGSSGFSTFGHVGIGAKHPVSVENEVTVVNVTQNPTVCPGNESPTIVPS